MKRLLWLLLFILLMPRTLFGQTTTVTGVVTDANSNAYFPGTVSAAIVLNSGQPLPAGVPASGSIGPFATTSGGNFSVTVASPFSWIFTICGTPKSIGPLGNPTPTQVCFSTAPIPISGASQIITGNLPTVPVLGPGGGGSTSVSVPCASSMTFTMASTFLTDFFVNLNCSVTSSVMAGTLVVGNEAVFTLTQDSVGGRTFAWPTVFLNTPPVNTVANSTTVATFQYCGTVGFGNTCPANSWQNTDVGPAGAAGAFDTGGIYVAKQCGGAASCFQVKGDAQWVIDATFNSTSTVTTSAGDIAFSATLDPTKVAWGNTNCSFSTAVGCSTYACPQTTISTVNSAHSVTLASACTGSSSGSLSVFVWTSDDGATLQAAMAALLARQTAKSGVPSNLFLPCASMGTSVPPLIGNQASIPASFSITGCGSGTVIVPFPKMNCTGGSGHGCLIDFPIATFATNGFTPSGVIRDIIFYGGGQTLHDAAATITANTSGIYVSFQYGVDNVWIIGWLSRETTIPGITNSGGAMWNSGTFAGGGNCGVIQGGAGTIGTVHGGALIPDVPGIGPSFNSNAAATYGVDIQGPATVSGTALYTDYGSSFLGQGLKITAGTMVLEGTTIFGSGMFIQGGTTSLHGVQFVSSANLQQTAGQVIDGGLNNLPFSSFTTFTAGNPHGVLSISGIADVAGNHVLNASWGTTATVTAPGGDTVDVSFTVNSSGTGQAASPTITDTFALGNGGFWKAPNTGCFLIQTGGTFGVLTNPVPSSLSRTGVTWTFSGTPVAGQSYTFYRHCA